MLSPWKTPRIRKRPAGWRDASPWAAFVLVGALLLAIGAGCGHSRGKEATPTAPFAYDTSRPLRFKDHGRVNAKYPLAVRDVSFVAARKVIRGYLVVPPQGGRVPAVIYLHGAGGDRRELLVPASWLAAHDAIALTLTAPSASATKPSGLAPAAALRWERDMQIRDVVAVRRAVDQLRSMPHVDRGRIGFVGWSAGARTGAIVSGVEPRIRVFVLMSGGALPVGYYSALAPARLRPELVRVLRQIDPLRFIARAHAGTILLQDARQDQIVPGRALDALAAAAPRGTIVRWYAAGHALNARAYRDQLAWLARKLAIEGPPIPGAREGP